MDHSITNSSTNSSSPEYLSPAYGEMQKRWLLVRRVRHLNETVRREPGNILPRGDNEGRNAYATRVALTFDFEALDEAIATLTGLATRHDAELGDDVPERLRLEWEDVDLRGTHGAVFVQHCIDAALQDGHGAILVDYPPVSETLTAAQEAALGLRAYMILIPIDRITAWREGRVLGRHTITMVKLSEEHVDVEGEFGAKLVQRTRTLYQRVGGDDGNTPYVELVVHEKQDGVGGAAAGWVEISRDVLEGPEWIPFHPFYGGERQGILASRPPLLGMAYSCLDHLYKTSQRSYCLSKTAVSMPIWIGRSDRSAGETVVLSSDLGLDVDVGGDAKFMEGSGVALAPLREDKRDIETQMAAQGLSLLKHEGDEAATATETRSRSNREGSKLARAVRSVSDAIEAALGSMAAFEGLQDARGKPNGGSISMSRTFADIEYTVEELRLLSDIQTEGKIGLRTLLAEIQRGGRLLQGVDIEVEASEAERREATSPGPVAFDLRGDEPTRPASAAA